MHARGGSGADFGALFRRLLELYGPQHWWPARTAFEVIVGAVLVQSTSWHNADRAVQRLRGAKVLEPQTLATLPLERLAELVRPSGYYRVKAQRLQAVCASIVARGGMARLAALDTTELRNALLEVRGIGEETADAILLYAFARPVFVVDAYARRLFSRYRSDRPALTDAQIRATVISQLGADVAALNEFHALIVAHCKTRCRVPPLCNRCALRAECRLGSAQFERREAGQ